MHAGTADVAGTEPVAAHSDAAGVAWLLAAAVLVVAAKNAMLAAHWDPFGVPLSTITRNLLVLAPVAALLFARGATGDPGRFIRLIGLVRPGSPSALAWTLVPAAVVASLALIVGAVTGYHHVGMAKVAEVVLGTALLEELLFRGALLALSIRTGDRLVRMLVPGFAFGCWHIVDAIHGAQDHETWGWALQVGWIAGTVVLLTLVSWLVFEPLRLRTRSIIGPWLLHAAVNTSMLVLGAAAAVS